MTRDLDSTRDTSFIDFDTITVTVTYSRSLKGHLLFYLEFLEFVIDNLSFVGPL